MNLTGFTEEFCFKLYEILKYPVLSIVCWLETLYLCLRNLCLRMKSARLMCWNTYHRISDQVRVLIKSTWPLTESNPQSTELISSSSPVEVGFDENGNPKTVICDSSSDVKNGPNSENSDFHPAVQTLEDRCTCLNKCICRVNRIELRDSRCDLGACDQSACGDDNSCGQDDKFEDYREEFQNLNQNVDTNVFGVIEIGNANGGKSRRRKRGNAKKDRSLLDSSELQKMEQQGKLSNGFELTHCGGSMKSRMNQDDRSLNLERSETFDVSLPNGNDFIQVVSKRGKKSKQKNVLPSTAVVNKSSTNLQNISKSQSDQISREVSRLLKIDSVDASKNRLFDQESNRVKERLKTDVAATSLCFVKNDGDRDCDSTVEISESREDGSTIALRSTAAVQPTAAVQLAACLPRTIPEFPVQPVLQSFDAKPLPPASNYEIPVVPAASVHPVAVVHPTAMKPVAVVHPEAAAVHPSDDVTSEVVKSKHLESMCSESNAYISSGAVNFISNKTNFCTSETPTEDFENPAKFDVKHMTTNSCVNPVEEEFTSHQPAPRPAEASCSRDVSECTVEHQSSIYNTRSFQPKTRLKQKRFNLRETQKYLFAEWEKVLELERESKGSRVVRFRIDN